MNQTPSRNSKGPPLKETYAHVCHVDIVESSAGQRIDNFLLRELAGVPKSHVYRLLRSGQVRVNGRRVKPSRKLLLGDNVRIPPVRRAESACAVKVPDIVADRLREAIVFEDGDYLALCKPAGMSVHGGSGIAYGVIDVVRSWRSYGFVELAHRLDRDTSGLLLLAKSRHALLRAQDALRCGDIVKRYFALLVGALYGGVHEVDAALLNNQLAGGERYVKIDRNDGKPARSRFIPRMHYHEATLCEVQIFSGRTHQIRVHALAIGHALAGDRKYGERSQQKKFRELGLRRMFLHAHYLELPEVRGRGRDFPRLVLNTPMTAELLEFLERLHPK